MESQMLCDDCVCQPVCSIYRATGYIIRCVYFHKDDVVRAKWEQECRNRLRCSRCHKGFNTDYWFGRDYCSFCGAKMEEKEPYDD